jgi:hypothetical protein
LSQHIVSIKNPTHYLLVDNIERKIMWNRNEKSYIKEKLHHLNTAQESGNIMPLYSFIKVTYKFWNISTVDGDIPMPSFPVSLTLLTMTSMGLYNIHKKNLDPQNMDLKITSVYKIYPITKF